MPKIEPYESQVRVAGPSSGRNAGVADFGSGAGLQQLGEATQQFGEFLLKKAEADDISKAKIAAGEFRAQQRVAFYEQSKFAESTVYQKPQFGTSTGGKAAIDAPRDGNEVDLNAPQVGIKPGKGETAIDYSNFSEKFVKSMDDDRLRMRGYFATEAGRDAFDELSARTRDELHEKAFVTQMSLAGTKAKVDAARLLDVYRNDANTNPESMESTLRDWRDGIALDPKIPAEIRDELMRKGASEIAKSAAFGVIDADPEAGMQMLREGKFDQYLDADARIAMQKHAVTKYEQKLTQQDRDATRLRQELEREEKARYAATSKDASELASKGKLTADWVISKKMDLSPEEFKYFLKQAGGGSDSDKIDMPTYTSLRMRASRGEDVREEAIKSANAGFLNKGAVDTLFAEVESSSSQAAGDTWYKTGRQHITTMLAPPPGATTGFEASMQAQALDEWLIWANSHPKATGVEREKARDQIVERHKAYSWDQITPAIPTPRFHEGDRNAIDPEASYKKAAEARKKGEISEAEFRREVQILQKWRNANRNRPESLEKPKAKP